MPAEETTRITMTVHVTYDSGYSQHSFTAMTVGRAEDMALAFINAPEPIEVGPGKFYPRSRVHLYEFNR